MEEKIYKYILKHNMISIGDTVVVGLSGGADSVCLFTVLNNLRDRLSINLAGVHINHCLRGEDANRDERFAKYLCEKHNIPFCAYKIDVNEIANCKHLSIEEAGRLARYDAFREVASQYKNAKIAVAHHMNDQAETVLFNMFRGAGMNGISGIKPVNKDIIRPLLCVSRQEIEHYAKDNKLLYMTDETNKSDEYMRNRIRNHILPYAVMNINENAIANINQSANICLSAFDYIKDVATMHYNELVTVDDEDVVINSECFLKLPAIIKQNVIMLAFEHMYDSLKDISYKNIEDVVTLFDLPVSKVKNLPDSMIAIREYEDVRLTRHVKEVETHLPQYKVEIRDWDNSEISKNDYTKFFDYDKIKTHLEMRTRRSGDYLIVDNRGSKKKLKDYFINEKVPASMRDNVPLFADGSHVVWVVGMRISEEYKVTANTKRVIIVTVDKA